MFLVLFFVHCLGAINNHHWRWWWSFVTNNNENDHKATVCFYSICFFVLLLQKKEEILIFFFELNSHWLFITLQYMFEIKWFLLNHSFEMKWNDLTWWFYSNSIGYDNNNVIDIPKIYNKQTNWKSNIINCLKVIL